MMNMRRGVAIGLAAVAWMGAMLLGGLLRADAASVPKRSWRLVRGLPALGSGGGQASCSSSQSCMVVDGSRAVELWDGERWRRHLAPVGLGAVTCREKWCAAVGGSPEGFDAAVWNGLRWRGVPIQTPFNLYGAVVSSVSCGSARRCFGVGWTTVHTTVNCPPDPLIPHCITSVPVVEQWDGRAWRLERVPEPAVATEALPRNSDGPAINLDAVSCPSPRMCMAVGHYWWKNGPYGLFAERWNGRTWTLLKPPASGQYDYFGGISCPRADVCVAVGTYGPPRAPRMFVERWDGTSWRIRRLATPAGFRGSGLNATSCPTARWCLAVGYQRATNGRQRLLGEVNTGSAWRSITPPTLRGDYAEFTSVSCAPAGTCFAIANTQRGGNVQSFVEQYR